MFNVWLCYFTSGQILSFSSVTTFWVIQFWLLPYLTCAINMLINLFVLLLICILSVQITGPQPENWRWVEEIFLPLHDCVLYKFILYASQYLPGRSKEAMSNYHGNHKTSYLLLPTPPAQWARKLKKEIETPLPTMESWRASTAHWSHQPTARKTATGFGLKWPWGIRSPGGRTSGAVVRNALCHPKS